MKPWAALAASTLAATVAWGGPALTPEEIEALRLRNSRFTDQAEPAAYQMAQKLGEAGNVEALKEIARLGDYRVLDSYVHAFWRFRGPLPAEAEPILARLLRDPKLRRSAIALIGRPPECPRSYASRELFDTLREIQADPAAAASFGGLLAEHFVCTTRRDVDMEMAEMITRSRATDRSAIVHYLVKHKAVDTVPTLERALAVIPMRQGDFIHASILTAFLQLDTPDSITAFYRRIAWIGRNPAAPGVEQEVSAISGHLQYENWPPRTPWRYEPLRPLLVSVPPGRHTYAMIQATRRIKDPAAARDLLAFIDGPYGAAALEAIIEIGTPADWRAAQEKVSSLPPQHALNEQKNKGLRDRLAANLAAPGKAVSERERTNRMQAWSAARSELEQKVKPQEALRQSDPARFAAEQEAYLARAEKLLERDPAEPPVQGYRATLAGEYERLATFTRLSLKNATRAVPLYERAIAIGAPLPRHWNAGVRERLGLADTLRFDLRDSARALELYQEVRARLAQEPRSRNDTEAAIESVMLEWLDAEIAFLVQGRRYAGQPSLEASGVATLLFGEGAAFLALDDVEMTALLAAARDKGGMSSDRKREAAARLEALPPSQARFMSAFRLLPALGSPERIAAFARRHDPTGFVSAIAFASLHGIDAMARENPGRVQREDVFGWSKADWQVMAAAEKATLGRSVAVVVKPDPRLATPESTWKTFVAALRASDFETMWKCTTPGIRNKFDAAFRSMTPEQRREAADSMDVFARVTEYGGFVEAFVGKKGKHGGIVTFGRRGKDWVIHEM
jgi:hypothetical protein